MFTDEFKILKSTNNLSKFLPKYFNQNPYFTENCNFDNQLTSLSHKQVVSERSWPKIDKVNAWMVTAETAPYMKIGGLGMVAKDFPESFNQTFNENEEYVTVITPLYLGKAPKKHAFKKGTMYTGAEGNSIKINKLKTIKVPFLSYSENELIEYPVDIYIGKLENTEYIFLNNETYFSINEHIYNNSAQDGCYVFNEHGVKETERFAFFSKAVYEFIKDTIKSKTPKVKKPNIIIANDWHAGSLSGLCKCLTHCQASRGDMSQSLASKLQELPVIHIAHHFGYQGWEFEKTPKILNSLYEDCARDIYKNTFTTHTENDRMKKAIMVGNSFNQACCNVNLADKVVTVSRNYRDEVTKEVEPFGYDFKDILDIRKNNDTFYGIVNGYEKTLIVPSKSKIEDLNKFFTAKRKFSYYDENSISEKFENKKTFIKLLSKLTTDKAYRKKVLPKIEMYEFEDIIEDLPEIDNIPILCATSRLVEQKGYDILADAIYDFIANGEYKTPPIFILGGAGSIELFDMLMKLKNRIAAINPVAARRLFVFRGFNDFFAYAIQLASDFYLMPSKFEPCGLTQMEAMAKGSVPVATSTGGLVDTIEQGVDGFRTEVFYSATRQIYGDPELCAEQYNNTKAFTKAMADAITTFYENKPKFDEMVKNAMKKDFSWNCKDNGAVFSYYKLFKTGKID